MTTLQTQRDTQRLSCDTVVALWGRCLPRPTGTTSPPARLNVNLTGAVPSLPGPVREAARATEPNHSAFLILYSLSVGKKHDGFPELALGKTVNSSRETYS